MIKRGLAVALMLGIFCILPGCSQKESPQETAQVKQEAVPQESSAAPEAREDMKWPTAPLQIIATGPAGGSIDTGARLFAQYLEKEIGMPVVVNTDAVVPQMHTAHESPADGNYMMFTMGHFLINNALGSIDFGLEDMEVCAVLSEDVMYGLWVNKTSPYQTLDDMIADMKARPGSVSVGMLTSSYIHLASEAMLQALDCEALLVDAGGDSARITALLGNQVDVSIVPYAAAKTYADSGDLRCLAVMSEDGKTAMNEVKTFQELGYDFDFPTNHTALYFPKGTDPEIVEKANEIVRKVQDNKEYADKLLANGSKTVPYQVPEAQEWLENANAAFMSIANTIK